MQEPSYHLEGVVRNRDELEDFTGPLDLILMLLSKNKIEIRDIQISLLLDQYLDYLRQMQEMDLEIASEFVQMASHLTYIKTRMLLAEEKEVTELDVLVSALEQLKNRDALAAVQKVAPELGKLAEAGLRTHTRGPLQGRTGLTSGGTSRRNCWHPWGGSCCGAPGWRKRKRIWTASAGRRPGPSYTVCGRNAASC